MAASASDPYHARRRLGAALKELRESCCPKKLRKSRGQKLEQVAEAVLMSTSKMPRLENGQGLPQVRDVELLATHYGASEEDLSRLLELARAGRAIAWWQAWDDMGEWAVVQAAQPNSLDSRSGQFSRYAFTPSFVQLPIVPGAPLRTLVEIRLANLDSLHGLISTCDPRRLEAIVRAAKSSDSHPELPPIVGIQCSSAGLRLSCSFLVDLSVSNRAASISPAEIAVWSRQADPSIRLGYPPSLADPAFSRVCHGRLFDSN
jgi:transcriptional regulator with XRE-family HTH domain